MKHPTVTLKEYQIATEVFGRPENFDPQADSAVRVQAGRLRLKLLDYYAHEGASDAIVVEMPNGAYSLNFRYRQVPIPTVVPAAIPSPIAFPKSLKEMRGSKTAVVALSLALLAALVAVGILGVAVNSARAGNSRAKMQSELTPAPELRTFWNAFESSPSAPVVIFSNAAFVGRPETGMRYLDPTRDPRGMVLDHYTGVGEVLAVHELDKVFGQLNQQIEVKRGSLFTLDDAKKSDLIFVGSPAENLNLLDLPGSQEFVFKRLASSPHKGDLGIVNVHPETGQPGIFYPSDSNQPLTEDYAIVALVPGLNPDRHVLILAGTTTIGTQAAVEYVCEKESMQELLRSLGIQIGSSVKPFEALLRVKVTRGVPVGVQLVATRIRK